MKNFILKKLLAVIVLVGLCITASAQVKYDSNNRFTIGNTTPYHDGYKYYDVTIKGNHAKY